MALISILQRYASRLHCVDMPCERKVHSKPIPKVGGLAIALGTVVPVVFLISENRMMTSVLIGGIIITLFGFLDDIREMGYKSKFCAQIAAALVVVLFGGIRITFLGDLLPAGIVLPDLLSIPLTLVVIIGVTNAINLADGLDGLAGGIMLLCFICIGFLAYETENYEIVLMSLAMGGAIFGFLLYNTHPATVFMGDAGSQLLGFLTITMALTISQDSMPVNRLFPLLLLGLPVLDTLVVMTSRISHGQSPFKADKNHLHHKLLQMNFFHREAVFIVYTVQAALMTAAYLLRFYSEWTLLLVYLAFALVTVSVLTWVKTTGWRLNRSNHTDSMIKTWFKTHIKDRLLLIKTSMTIVEFGLPLLLFVGCIMPDNIPLFNSLGSFVLIILIGTACLLRPSQHINALRVAFYFAIPPVLYYGEVRQAAWISPEMTLLYNLAFGILVIFAVITLKTTQRQGGFKSVPLDFLILFVAIVVPNLKQISTSDLHLGFLVTKIVACFFMFEILIGELRGPKKRLTLMTSFALLILGLKGVV